MGGDRDGNPNVTAKVTREVAYLARWIAADLYLREIDTLRFELSMDKCNDKLARLAEGLRAAGERGSDIVCNRHGRRFSFGYKQLK